MAAQVKTYSTKELSGMRVVGGRSGDARIGKVARFVFHPTAKRCVGFIVKRPDLALMFHRPDLFVPLDAFSLEDGRIVLHDDTKDATGSAAIARLGLDWDRCVMWEGMQLISERGEVFGTAGDIVFSQATGKVISLAAERGATAKALVGQIVIPNELILGFKTGVGTELAQEWTENEEGEAEPLRGAIVVSDKVGLQLTQGGIAEAAGKQAAIMQDKARRQVDKVKPKASQAAKKTEEAVAKGAFATGRQLGRAKGMFSAFKEEYDKASGKSNTKKRK